MSRAWSAHRAVCLTVLALIAAPMPAAGDSPADTRILVVRERHTASLLDGAFGFEVLKLRGYSIDVRIDGARRVLRLGQSFGPDDASCAVTFKKISPETRIARFVTDCP